MFVLHKCKFNFQNILFLKQLNHARNLLGSYCVQQKFQVLAEACGAEVTERLMLPTILTMATDLVANVRFNVAKTLTVLGPILTPAVMTSQVREKFGYNKLQLHSVSRFLISS